MSSITDLLAKGVNLDVHLMSDQLNTILVEMCEMLSEQRDEIQFLRTELKKFATKSEMKESIASATSEIKESKEMIENIAEAIDTKIEELRNDLDEKTTACKEGIDIAVDNVKMDLDTKVKQVQGDCFIVTQQMKDLTAANTTTKKTFNQIREEISKLEGLFEKNKDQTVEVVASRVNQIESDLKKHIQEQTNHNKLVEQAINENNNHNDDFEKDVKSDIHCLTVELKEVRRLVVDAPSFDVDGVVNTETLVRAIQRDSRRIDNFNEMVISVKDENDKIKQCFTQLSGCMQQFQLQMQDFVVEHNAVKAALIDQVDQSFVNSESVRSDIQECKKSVSDLLGVTSTSINSISSTFLQVYQFLNKVTTRAIPLFQSFDDEILEFQRLTDLFIAESEERPKNTDILSQALIDQENRHRKIGEKMTDETVSMLKSEFQMKMINVPILEKAQTRKRFIFAREADEEPAEQKEPEQPKAEAPIPSVDLELRQNVNEVKRKVERLSNLFDKLKGEVDERIEGKADSVQLERIVDKVRVMTGKMRDDMTKLQKKMRGFVEKDDMEIAVKSIAQESTASMDGIVGRSARSLHSGMGKPVVVPELQALSPYQQIYGQSVSQRSQGFTGNRPRVLLSGK